MPGHFATESGGQHPRNINLHALFGEKHDEKAKDYSKGYYDALADMEADEKEEQSATVSR